jgi:hypothetical protein
MRISHVVISSLLCLVLAPACGEGSFEADGLALVEPKLEYGALLALSDTSARPCAWDCELCPDGQGCLRACTEIGDCGSSCNVVAQCMAGYGWDETSCSCVADSGD